MAEHQQAVEQLAEKENEIYMLHEANLADILSEKQQIAALRACSCQQNEAQTSKSPAFQLELQF